MQQQPSDRNTCPANERDVFAGKFSARLREIALGSSRTSALTAVQQSTLDDWSLRDNVLHLQSGLVQLNIRPGREAHSIATIGAQTPYGEFLVDGEHWVARQISKRVNKRFSTYATALQAEAEELLGQVLTEAYLGRRARAWVIDTDKSHKTGNMQNAKGVVDPNNFAQRTSATSTISESLRARIDNLCYFGWRTLEEAAELQAMRYDAIRHAPQWAIERFSRRPVSVGPYRDDTLFLTIEHKLLSAVHERFKFGARQLALQSCHSVNLNPLIEILWITSGLEVKTAHPRRPELVPEF